MLKKPMFFSLQHENNRGLGEFCIGSVKELCCATNAIFSVALFHFTENSGSKLSFCGSEMKLESKMKMSGLIFFLL